MLDSHAIAKIVAGAAHQWISDADIERIVPESATDSEGNAALRIILVLRAGAAQKLTGDNALDLLVGVQKDLRDAGEERFPIVEYATEQEIALDEGPEIFDVNEEDS